MPELRVTIGATSFAARWEERDAPATCAALRRLLPFKSRLIHVRWSGEACWVPMGDLRLGVGFENATSYPAPGQLLIYVGDVSETEILIPYGACRFASKAGQLAGNHFATILEPAGLREVGQRILWEGAQDFGLEEA